MTTIQSEPILFTIFGSSIIGIILYMCKELPLKIFKSLIDSLTTTIKVNQSSDRLAYSSLEYELGTKKLYYICGRFQIIHEWLLKKISVAPAEKTLFLTKLQNIFVLVDKKTDEYEKYSHSYEYTLKFFSKDVEKINDYMISLLPKYSVGNDENNIRIFKKIGSNWEFFKKRKVNISCILEDYKNDIIKHLSYFLCNGEEYLKRDKPHNLGILLYGKPGCGKTRFIFQMACVLDLNIYYVNLSDFNNDNDFLESMIKIKTPSIILFEDIDRCDSLSIKEENEHSSRSDLESKTGVSMSTLLNTLDGLLSQEDQIVIATTNHLEKLDPALTRDGRFDIKSEFKYLSKNEMALHISEFYNTKMTCEEKKCLIQCSIASLYKVLNTNKFYKDAIFILSKEII